MGIGASTVRLIGRFLVAILAFAVAAFPLSAAQARMPSAHAAQGAKHHVHHASTAYTHAAHVHHAHRDVAASQVPVDPAATASAKSEPGHDKGCCVACHAIDALTLASIEPPCSAHALLHLTGDPQLPGQPPSGIERPPRSH
jgi:hypothetical protein